MTNNQKLEEIIESLLDDNHALGERIIELENKFIDALKELIINE